VYGDTANATFGLFYIAGSAIQTALIGGLAAAAAFGQVDLEISRISKEFM
jgi:hypothetical protein